MDQKIIEDLKSGQFEITVHAAIRMNEREVTKEDLIEVGRTALSIKNQDSPSAPFKIKRIKTLQVLLLRLGAEISKEKLWTLSVIILMKL